MLRNKNKTGFTLVELLVVIAIIGTLSSIAVINLRSSTKKASGSAALQTMKNIVPLLQTCYLSNDELMSNCPPDFEDPPLKFWTGQTTSCELCNGQNWPELPEGWAYDYLITDWQEDQGINWQMKSTNSSLGIEIFCTDSSESDKTECTIDYN